MYLSGDDVLHFIFTSFSTCNFAIDFKSFNEWKGIYKKDKLRFK